jgi:predicted alpha/beta superfamily hydrolase
MADTQDTRAEERIGQTDAPEQAESAGTTPEALADGAASTDAQSTARADVSIDAQATTDSAAEKPPAGAGPPRWEDYPTDRAGSTVVGTVKVLRGLRSPELGNERDILVYLPPSYGADQGRRYPVLYMHDGQNLFDAATSFSGEWEVDQTLEHASAEGLEAIVVGIPNAGPERLNEYSPFPDARHDTEGRGDAYADFIVHTLKPIVDRDFRTLTDRESTGIAGSSMGGLISLYAFFRNADVFGFTGVMSPALWFAGAAILPYVQAAPYVGGRIYVDVGTREGRETLSNVRKLRDILIDKGYRKGTDFLYVVEMGGTHSEAAWARRLRRELDFLLGGTASVTADERSTE